MIRRHRFAIRRSPRRAFAPILSVFLAALCLLPTGCNDDTTAPPGTGNARRIDVPFDKNLGAVTMIEALAMAQPGDSIFVGATYTEVLSEPFFVESDQTPLYVSGQKTRPTVSGSFNGALLTFRNPKPGTTVRFIAFRGGDPALAVTGRGSLTVNDCSFQGGDIHLDAQGDGASLIAADNLMVEPARFGIRAVSATVTATNNTIVRAGDCGVLLAGGATATLHTNLVYRSANFGIACMPGTLDAASCCNDVFGSGNAGYAGCPPADDDFNLDPMFCDEANGDFKLQDGSPCTPANSGTCRGESPCGRIGAFNTGCPTGGG